jgi:hypothetical protein
MIFKPTYHATILPTPSFSPRRASVTPASACVPATWLVGQFCRVAKPASSHPTGSQSIGFLASFEVADRLTRQLPDRCRPVPARQIESWGRRRAPV